MPTCGGTKFPAQISGRDKVTPGAASLLLQLSIRACGLSCWFWRLDVLHGYLLTRGIRRRRRRRRKERTRGDPRRFASSRYPLAFALYVHTRQDILSKGQSLPSSVPSSSPSMWERNRDGLLLKFVRRCSEASWHNDQ